MLRLLTQAFVLFATISCTPTTTSDAAVSVDVSPIPEVEIVAPFERGVFVEVSTQNEQIRGEIIAIYDHSIFWGDPEDKKTFALFVDDALAPFPNDRSVRIFDRANVILSTMNDDSALPFAQRMQNQNIVMERPPLLGAQSILTGNSDYHLEEEGFGHFAFDLTRTNEKGLRFENNGLQNEDYFVFGDDVFSPVTGTVIDIVRDAPDNLPGSYPNPDDYLNTPTNWVGISLFGNYYLYIFHFEQNSIGDAITIGDFISTGDYLGRVGNSGVSLEPHLHVTLYYFDEVTNRSWSVPLQFKDLIVDGETFEYSTPQTGQEIQSD